MQAAAQRKSKNPGPGHGKALGKLEPKPKPVSSPPQHSPQSLKSLNTPDVQLQQVPSPELWAVISAMSPVDDERDHYVDDVGLVSWERMDQLMQTPEYKAKGGL